MTEAPSTSEQGPEPFANSPEEVWGVPEEVRGQKRPMRPCPFLGQYFNGTPTAYAEFKRVSAFIQMLRSGYYRTGTPRTSHFGRGD
ncbi:hypothetical protein RHMOL_Rhmol06G0120100 [Rhododendron molle]|uniref:Uncharacterized protein n=1 Tax=Rhododendron molle TaxID=49168 RepID=A0ACC0NDA3_RHOML|nr:hypothetical protein RHMOL_Rhmol06G0120100 [Rhododendron molle]